MALLQLFIVVQVQHMSSIITSRHIGLVATSDDIVNNFFTEIYAIESVFDTTGQGFKDVLVYV